MRDDPSLVRLGFDEAIRLESPVQTLFRTTTTDVELDGALIPRGRKILMFLGSAIATPGTGTSRTGSH